MRIRFVTFSALGARSPRLQRVGLAAQGAGAPLPSLGALTIAGATPAGVEVEFVEVADAASACDAARGVDLVAVSASSAHAFEAYRLADRCRAQGVPVVLGGLHASARPGEAQAHADCVVVGEGEAAWPRLVDDLRYGRLARVYDTRAHTFDLSLAPIPRYDLLDAARYGCLPVQLARRCPAAWSGPAAGPAAARHRHKPIAGVIADVRAARAAAPRAAIRFVDADALPDPVAAKPLLRALAHEGVRWGACVEASVAADAELLALMRDSGCEAVEIAVDLARGGGLAGAAAGAGLQAARERLCRGAIERLQSFGIAVTGRFVLGLDGAGPEVFAAVARFAASSGLDAARAWVPTPCPGTPLYARLARAGRLLRPAAWELCTLFDVNYVPDRMSVAELEEGYAWLLEALHAAGTRGDERGCEPRAAGAMRTPRRGPSPVAATARA